MAAVPDSAPSRAADPRRLRRPDPDLGVFETLLVIDGRPVELDAHLTRLAASLESLFGAGPPPGLREAAFEKSAGTELGRLRLTVAPGAAEQLEAQIATTAVEPELVFPSPERAVALGIVRIGDGLGAHKWADRSLLEEAQAGLPEEALPLIADEDDSVLEASRANLFAVRDGALVTPPADGRILPGVTRMRVLEIAAAAELETHEVELRRDDLLAADEVFLSGSVRGIEPVGAIDGAKLDARSEVGCCIAADLRRTWMVDRSP